MNYIKPASNENHYINNSRLQMDIGADKKIAADYTDALEDSTPVYPDVMPISLRDHDRLQRIGSDHGLLRIAIMSLPNNGIRLIGKNITRFEREILKVFERSGHSRVEVRDNTIEMDGIMYIGPQHFSGEVRRMLLASDRWETDKKVSCEVIAVAHDKITSERVFFSVVPAHLILSKEQCKSMAGVNSNLSHIQSILKQQTPDCKYEYENENQRRCQKLLPQPLLSYGLWDVGNTKRSPESNKSESFEQVFDSLPVMSDMALLKFDVYESDELASKADAFAIPSKCHLDLLSKRQQRVIVGNLEGRLIYCPQCVGSGNERYGLHLAFTITTKDSNGKTHTLTEGDSGLAVFFKGKQDQLIPVGMLVGKFAEEIEDFDSEIYQAIVLSHAFKEIEHDHPDTIGNIQVLETCHRTAGKLGSSAESASVPDDAVSAYSSNFSETSSLATPPKASTVDIRRSQIIDLLNSNGVLHCKLMHIPDESNCITITGKGVDELIAKLSQVASSEECTFTVKDIKFGPANDEFCLTNTWVEQRKTTRSMGTLKLSVGDQCLSVIAAIMQGKDRKRRQPRMEYYGMTTAHSLLTEEQISKLMSSTEHFAGVRHEVNTRALEGDWYVSVIGKPDIDIIGVPCFLYKYWIPEHALSEWAVLQDIAFFKLDEHQLHHNGLIDSLNFDVTKAEPPYSANEGAYIVDILSQDDLDELVGSTICCAGKPGKLIPSPRLCCSGFTFGAHLSFILDGNERLAEGDPGSILCLEEKNQGRVPILGMFIGQLKSDNRIHQAVILSWNIRQAEKVPELALSDIKLAETCLRFSKVQEVLQPKP